MVATNNMLEYFDKSSSVIESLKNNLSEINNICDEIKNCFSKGNKILIAGNGGSASDAQHFSGEFFRNY